jgi:hypothetical protein
MEYTYCYRRVIARITFSAVVIALLLALNFRIWGGCGYEGDLSYLIIDQTKDLDNCFLFESNSEIVKEAVQIKQLTDTIFTGIILGSVLFLLFQYIILFKGKQPFKRGFTLVSLCIRIND